MPENNEWEHVFDVAKRLREKAVQAMNEGLFEVAEHYADQATKEELSVWIHEIGGVDK